MLIIFIKPKIKIPAFKSSLIEVRTILLLKSINSQKRGSNIIIVKAPISKFEWKKSTPIIKNQFKSLLKLVNKWIRAISMDNLILSNVDSAKKSIYLKEIANLAISMIFNQWAICLMLCRNSNKIM